MPSENNTLHKVKRITIDLPSESLRIIDSYCKDNYVTRRKWFFDAMNTKLELDGLSKKKKIDFNKEEVPRPEDT